MWVPVRGLAIQRLEIVNRQENGVSVVDAYINLKSFPNKHRNSLGLDLQRFHHRLQNNG